MKDTTWLEAELKGLLEPPSSAAAVRPSLSYLHQTHVAEPGGAVHTLSQWVQISQKVYALKTEMNINVSMTKAQKKIINRH